MALLRLCHKSQFTIFTQIKDKVYPLPHTISMGGKSS